MTADASLRLQEAIYGALIADSVVMGLVAGVFDHVPEGQALPYVVIGEDTEREAGTKSTQGSEHTLVLHVFARVPGRRTVKEILAALWEALHERALVLTGHRLVRLRFAFQETLREPDGETYHGIARYRALTEKL